MGSCCIVDCSYLNSLVGSYISVGEVLIPRIGRTSGGVRCHVVIKGVEGVGLYICGPSSKGVEGVVYLWTFLHGCRGSGLSVDLPPWV